MAVGRQSPLGPWDHAARGPQNATLKFMGHGGACRAMPACACGNRDLYLLGFEASPDLGSVVVSYRCPKCGQVTKGNYAEKASRLREG